MRDLEARLPKAYFAYFDFAGSAGTSCVTLRDEMSSVVSIESAPGRPLFTSDEVKAVLETNGWLRLETPAAQTWMERAATLLGPRTENREALRNLLRLIFEYDARAVLAQRASQEVLSRAGARLVVRKLATLILSGSGEFDSNQFKELMNTLRKQLPYSSRDLLRPMRVTVAGTSGDGALDRIILLLDGAAAAEGLAPVKSVRNRILEFCASLD